MIAPDDDRTAIVVEVPAADPCVAAICAQHDPAAPAIPAHVTVLYPFMEPDAVDDAVLARLAAAVADVAAFRFTLAEVDAFPEVVFLAPAPVSPFEALIRRVCAAFPDFPPYEGRHAHVVPHLTVAHVEPGARDVVLAAVRAQLPPGGIAAECRGLTVMRHASGRWTPWHHVPLGR